MRVDEAIAQALSEQGVQHVFAAGGAARGGLVSALETRIGEVVSSVDASACVGMADGYARASRKVGVVAIDPLSRLAGAIAPLMEAAHTGTPLVVLCSSRQAGSGSSTAALWIRGVGAAHDHVTHPASVAGDLNRAFQRAVTEERPVVVEIPTDLLEADAGDQRPVVRPAAASRRAVGADALDAALGLIASAQRPVVLAGWGAVVSEAGEELVQLADRIGGVLATTLRAKGLFGGHPRDIGIFGRLSSDMASSIISESDCVVAFGASLNPFTTFGGALVEDKRVVQVDHDPSRIGLTTWTAESVSGDVLLASQAMNAALEDAAHEPITQWAQQVEITLSGAAGSTAPQRSDVFDVASVMCQLNEILPGGRSLVCDLGHFVVDAWRLVDIAHPDRLINMNSSGSSGLGLAGGVGVALARPGEVTLVVLDDAALIMNPSSLVTAVNCGLPVLLAVCNRGSSDVARFAESLGAEAATIGTVDGLVDLKDRLGRLTGPMVLDLRLPPEA